jgi:hypothetical protein
LLSRQIFNFVSVRAPGKLLMKHGSRHSGGNSSEPFDQKVTTHKG